MTNKNSGLKLRKSQTGRKKKEEIRDIEPRRNRRVENLRAEREK